MNDTLSTRNVEYAQETSIPASGEWTFTPRSVPQAEMIIGQGTFRNASIVLWLSVSSLTAIPDPWFIEGRRGASASAATVGHSERRHRITLADALKLADEIMRRAEEGRLRAAEEEANRQFDLENVS